MGNLKHGWIRLDRSLQQHWLWGIRPYDKARAWIDLLMMANYEERKMYSRNSLQIVKVGDIVTSCAKLAIRWGWNIKTVKRFLMVLKDDQMVTVKSTRQWTTISIVNYEKFQNIGFTKYPSERSSKYQPNTQQEGHQKGDNETIIFNNSIKQNNNKTKHSPSEMGQPEQPEDEEYTMMTEWKWDDTE